MQNGLQDTEIKLVCVVGQAVVGNVGPAAPQGMKNEMVRWVSLSG